MLRTNIQDNICKVDFLEEIKNSAYGFNWAHLYSHSQGRPSETKMMFILLNKYVKVYFIYNYSL